jgi:hypothetical protein
LKQKAPFRGFFLPACYGQTPVGQADFEWGSLEVAHNFLNFLHVRARAGINHRFYLSKNTLL